MQLMLVCKVCMSLAASSNVKMLVCKVCTSVVVSSKASTLVCKIYIIYVRIYKKSIKNLVLDSEDVCCLNGTKFQDNECSVLFEIDDDIKTKSVFDFILLLAKQKNSFRTFIYLGKNSYADTQ